MLVYANSHALSVLHPRHKLEYFKKHNWEEAWVDTARDIVRNEFNRSYAPMDVEGGEDGMHADGNEAVSHCFYFVSFLTSDSFPDRGVVIEEHQHLR